MTETFLNLQQSESSVAAIAATIFAAYMRNGEINEVSEDEFVRKSVAIAIKLVQHAEAAVKSDHEWTKPVGNSGPIL
jgi:hypothetical protein